jgi:hypothetical protein
MSERVISHSGARCKIKSGWMDEGKSGIALCTVEHDGLGQRWTMVLWDGDEDPDCFISAGLEITITKWANNKFDYVDIITQKVLADHRAGGVIDGIGESARGRAESIAEDLFTHQPLNKEKVKDFLEWQIKVEWEAALRALRFYLLEASK